jgi:hypothetical protein
MSAATDSSDERDVFSSLSNASEAREAAEGVKEERMQQHEDMQDLDETRQRLEDSQQVHEPSTIDEKVDAILDKHDGAIPPDDELTKGTTVISEATDENIRAHCPNGIGNTVLEDRLGEVAQAPSARRLLNYLASTLSAWIVDDEYTELRLAEEYNARELSAIHQEVVLGGNLRGE